MTKDVTIQFSTSTAFASEIIRRLSHSAFSHCDIVVPGEGLLGVSGPDKSIADPGGVLIRSFAPWPYLAPPKKCTLATDNADGVISNAKSQLGKPFDNDALYHFLSASPGDRNWREESSWFCSELIAFCLEAAGFFPYKLVAAKNRITPGDLLLMLNGFMTPDDIEQFSEEKTA